MLRDQRHQTLTKASPDAAPCRSPRSRSCWSQRGDAAGHRLAGEERRLTRVYGGAMLPIPMRSLSPRGDDRSAGEAPHRGRCGRPRLDGDTVILDIGTTALNSPNSLPDAGDDHNRNMAITMHCARERHRTPPSGECRRNYQSMVGFITVRRSTSCTRTWPSSEPAASPRPGRSGDRDGRDPQ